MPSHPARALDVDLQAAGISKWTPQGKLDFHSLRVCFVSLTLEAGASVKEAQSLARHTDPALTMNTYGRSRPARLAEFAEKVGEAVKIEPELATSLQRQVVGMEKTQEIQRLENPGRGFDSRRLHHFLMPQHRSEEFYRSAPAFRSSRREASTRGKGPLRSASVSRPSRSCHHCKWLRRIRA